MAIPVINNPMGINIMADNLEMNEIPTVLVVVVDEINLIKTS